MHSGLSTLGRSGANQTRLPGGPGSTPSDGGRGNAMSDTIHQRFVEMINRPEPEIDLAHAALLISQEENSQINPQSYLDQLDRWATSLTPRLEMAVAPEHFVAHINRFLFDEMGFQGNIENYYDPLNSYLDQVIERRQGIPITLAVLYIELARRVGFTVLGIGMPGHFLIKPATRKADFYVDCFDRGRILSTEDCERKIHDLYGGSLPFQKAFLAPLNRRQILTRMLYNLKSIYLQSSEYTKALSVVDKLLHLSPDAPTEMRDRGILHYRLGRFQDAVIDLQKYLLYDSEAKDAARIRQMILMLQNQLRKQQEDWEEY